MCELQVMRCCSYPLPLNSIIKVKGVRGEQSSYFNSNGIRCLYTEWDEALGRRAFHSWPSLWRGRRRLLCDYDDPVWSEEMKFLPRPLFERGQQIKCAGSHCSHTHINILYISTIQVRGCECRRSVIIYLPWLRRKSYCVVTGFV